MVYFRAIVPTEFDGSFLLQSSPKNLRSPFFLPISTSRHQSFSLNFFHTPNSIAKGHMARRGGCPLFTLHTHDQTKQKDRVSVSQPNGKDIHCLVILLLIKGGIHCFIQFREQPTAATFFSQPMTVGDVEKKES
jgi:hypothetical protein